MEIEYKKVDSNFEELKKYGKIINGELNLQEGVYCKYDPYINNFNNYIKSNKNADN